MNQREQMVAWFSDQLDQRCIQFIDTNHMYDFDAPDNRAAEQLLTEANRHFRLKFNRAVSPLELNEAFYSACYYRNKVDRLARQRSWWHRLWRRMSVR